MKGKYWGLGASRWRWRERESWPGLTEIGEKVLARRVGLKGSRQSHEQIARALGLTLNNVADLLRKIEIHLRATGNDPAAMRHVDWRRFITVHRGYAP